MKRLAVFLIFLLVGAIVPAAVMAEEPVATLNVTAGQPESFQVESAKIYWDGLFMYDPSSGWEAEFHVVFTDGTGVNHSVVVTEEGQVDAENHYRWVLKSLQTAENIETNEVGLFESWKGLTVEAIDPISEKVVIMNDNNGKTYTLYKGDRVDISEYGSEQTVLELTDIETSFLGSKAKLTLHHITAVSGVVELYPVQSESNPQPPTPNDNQTNTTPQIPQLNLSTPAAMIVVGEHAAGADVAAGAKVAIAVQKWIDLIKEKAGDAIIPELGGFMAKLATLQVQNLNADAMLDSEVRNPDTIAPLVYTVGGPVANEYTKEILEKNAARLPVKFMKEGNQWYIVDKNGKKWGSGYGVIIVIPVAENQLELQKRLAEGKIKVADIVVAGTDRRGTYAACDLLQGEFMKPVLGKKPEPTLNYFLRLQTRMLMLFTDNPMLSIKPIDPSNPFQLQVTAIIVDKKGEIIEVVKE